MNRLYIMDGWSSQIITTNTIPSFHLVGQPDILICSVCSFPISFLFSESCDNIKIMPCVEGDRSDCQPEASSIARNRRLRQWWLSRGDNLICHPQHRA